MGESCTHDHSEDIKRNKPFSWPNGKRERSAAAQAEARGGRAPKQARRSTAAKKEDDFGEEGQEEWGEDRLGEEEEEEEAWEGDIAKARQETRQWMGCACSGGDLVRHSVFDQICSITQERMACSRIV